MTSVFRSLGASSKEKIPEQNNKSSVFRSLPSKKKEKQETKDSTALSNFIEDDDLQRQIERSSAVSLQGFVEGAAGAPGNIASLANTLTGGVVPGIKHAAEVFPTSEKIKEFGEKATLGYTKPKNPFEETAKEFMSDVGSFSAFPSPANAPGTGSRIINAARTWKPLIVPFLGQSTKQAAKAFGSDEKSSEFWKLGSMIVTDVMTNRGRGSSGYINHLFREAETAIPAGATANANRFRTALMDLQTNLQRGGTSPDKTHALTKINEMLQRITQRGNDFFVDVAELPAARRSINSIREGLGGWGSDLGMGGKRRAIRNLEDVKRLVIDTGMEYGAQQNPRFADYWSAANEASNIASQSNLATRFLEKILGSKTVNKILGGSAAGHAAGAAISGHSVLGSLAKGALIGGAGAVSGATGYGLGKVIYRMARSPNLRNYYTNLFQSSAREDAALVEKYAAKIKKEEDKHEKKEQALIKSILSR